MPNLQLKMCKEGVSKREALIRGWMHRAIFSKTTGPMFSGF